MYVPSKLCAKVRMVCRIFIEYLPRDTSGVPRSGVPAVPDRARARGVGTSPCHAPSSSPRPPPPRPRRPPLPPSHPHSPTSFPGPATSATKREGGQKTRQPTCLPSLSSRSHPIVRTRVVHFVLPLTIAAPNDEHLPHAANALKLLYISVADKPPEWFAENLQKPQGMTRTTNGHSTTSTTHS
jgi:hypothetical protein